MPTAKLGINGLYVMDSSIFDLFKIPVSMDKDVLLNEIIAECFDFEVVYPNPDIFKNVLGSWSAHRIPVWEKIVALCNMDYNPLENYDRFENWTDNREAENTSQIRTSADSESNETYKKAGFDSDSPKTANTTKVTGTDSGRSDGQGNSEEESTHTGRIHGNIGVTTTQRMAEAELVTRAKLDPYAYIVDEFIDKFCIQVYY